MRRSRWRVLRVPLGPPRRRPSCPTVRPRMRVSVAGLPSARTPTPSVGCATPDTRYLDFNGAARAIAEAREEAAELGDPTLAPPIPLEKCRDRATILMALAAPRASWGGVEMYRTL